MNKKGLLAFLFLTFFVSMGAIRLLLAQDEILIWADETRAPIMEELGRDFEAEFGVAVRVQQVALPDAPDLLLTAGPVGEGPDILIFPHDRLGSMVANGALTPVDLGGREDEFLSSALEAMQFNGQLYGVPYAFENLALVRNVDLVPEPPATFEEMRELAATLPEGAQVFGIQNPDTYHHFPVVSAFGGYIFGRNEDGSFNVADIGLSSQGGLAAGEWLADMYVEGLMSPGLNNDEIFALFEDGKLAMFVTGPWFSQRIIDSGVNYALSPLPGSVDGLDVGAPFLGVQGFGISAWSENKLLAEQFILDFIATEETMRAIFDANPRPSAYLGVDTSSEPNMEAFLEAGRNAIPMPAIPEMGAVWAAANDAFVLISLGEDPAATLSNATNQIANAIALVQSEERIVGLPGSHQSLVGCAGDWDPACEQTFLENQGGDIYVITLTLPAGDYEFKVAMNGAWDENYGVDGERDGGNYTLSLAEETEITFTYDDNTHVLTTDVDS